MNEMSKRTLKAVPKDFSVRPLTTQAEISAASQPTQDGTCGLWWDDAIATYYTPAPAARCPFEAFHAATEEGTEERTEVGLQETLNLALDHPAALAAARVALADGWTCDTHEPLPWGECPDCTDSHLRTARRALTAALPHLTAATRDARPPEPLPCGCENPLNAVHLLDH